MGKPHTFTRPTDNGAKPLALAIQVLARTYKNMTYKVCISLERGPHAACGFIGAAVLIFHEYL